MNAVQWFTNQSSGIKVLVVFVGVISLFGVGYGIGYGLGTLLF